MIEVDAKIQKHPRVNKMYSYITLKDNTREFPFSCDLEELRNLIERLQENYGELLLHNNP